MEKLSHFNLVFFDYLSFALYILLLSLIGYYFGKKKKQDSSDYFLAGRTLPWYVVGSSYIASNISTEHFIGMVGAAFVYGICVAMSEWANVASFSLLIWVFIPFLMSAKVFSTPEFLEKRFNLSVRQFFAVVTIVSNIIAFLAAVLYGGGIVIQQLFNINLWTSIIIIGLIAGVWSIYGGLKSIAWMDVFTVVVMVVGGLLVTILGLYMLSGEDHSLVSGFKVMLERNSAQTGIWKEVVEKNIHNMVGTDHYSRLSLIQPVSHQVSPWPNLILGVFTISIWYNALNQFMIQRVLAAKSSYHARMGIVFAGYLKVLLPVIVVLPGLILFARYPDVLNLPWPEIRPEADKGYIVLLQTLVPAGLRGLFIASLFGAVQSTVSAVLNSTSTVFTLDVYKRMFRKNELDSHYVRIGRWSSFVIIIVAIVLAGFIGKLGGSLFVYIQTLYAFFAPPFAAIFVLGILFRRINGKGAIVSITVGFIFSILLKIYIQYDAAAPSWLTPFQMQAIVSWLLCVIVCVVVSLLTEKPRAEQVTDDLTINWKKINIFEDLGNKWYKSVILWWLIFVLLVACLVIIFF
ncbi:SLC5 family protein [Petrimonas mucosa]|uniref:Sodium/glucose cotransporter n=1 Tax=Petrimonas mucosa TaxID=1642646 RepID=A0A1G4G6B8_9BACT|nr:sodium/solute symporter [Petrimonas mucosa]SCM57263.1 Sodium/glucose cotransporter [Petrimonas mucosa]